MNSDITNTATLSSKKADLRRRGIFFFLAAMAFGLKGIFFLNDTTTWILLTAVEFVYVFAFPEKNSPKKPQDTWIKKIIRFLAQFALLLLVGFTMVLAWVWLWKATGMPVSFLAAITCALAGLVLVIGSFVSVFDE